MRNRVLLAIGVAVIALFTYYKSREVNPVTGEVQHISLSPDQEVAIGLQSAPGMAAEFGGEDPDSSVQADVASVGRHVVQASDAARTPYQFSFHVLADANTVNAFALPGGPVFITKALLRRLENEAQLAGVLGHEVGHVVGRHSAAQIAKSQLATGLVTAVGLATSDEQGRGEKASMVAGVVAQMMQLRYGRRDETQADDMGVKFMSAAGFDPRAMARVMEILKQASGGGRQPEFMSSHPDPGNREAAINAEIRQMFPSGVPASLSLGRPLRVSG